MGPPFKSELMLRLLICDLVGEEPTRESVATLRDDIAELMSRLDELEASAYALTHRRKYLMLVNEFLRRVARTASRVRRRARARAVSAKGEPTRSSRP